MSANNPKGVAVDRVIQLEFERDRLRALLERASEYLQIYSNADHLAHGAVTEVLADIRKELGK